MSQTHHLHTGVRGALLLGLAAALAGCSTTPQLDAHYGEAVLAARAMQTINPQGSANRDPVSGIDGKAGVAAMDHYQEGFKTPQKTFDVINIGGSLTGQ